MPQIGPGRAVEVLSTVLHTDESRFRNVNDILVDGVSYTLFYG